MTGIQVGNAPCSWGSLEFGGLGEGIQFSRMLDELAETGYTGTELGDWGFMPTDPDVLRGELAKRALTMLGAFVPVALKDPNAHKPGAAEAVKVASLLAAVSSASDHKPFLVLADNNGAEPVRTRYAGRVTREMGLSPDDWRVFAQGAEYVAHAVRDKTGLRTVFHHHCAGYIETPDEIARLMDLTDPNVFGLVFDTGHYAFGTGAPSAESVLEGLTRFANRIQYVHFKDCAPRVAEQARAANWDYFDSVRHGIFCELGKGCVDFAQVLAQLNKRNYQGWITVEQDVLPGMGAPKESAQRNRQYLRALGL